MWFSNGSLTTSDLISLVVDLRHYNNSDEPSSHSERCASSAVSTNATSTLPVPESEPYLPTDPTERQYPNSRSAQTKRTLDPAPDRASSRCPGPPRTCRCAGPSFVRLNRPLWPTRTLSNNRGPQTLTLARTCVSKYVCKRSAFNRTAHDRLSYKHRLGVGPPAILQKQSRALSIPAPA